jgi:hypothetical protein
MRAERARVKYRGVRTLCDCPVDPGVWCVDHVPGALLIPLCRRSCARRSALCDGAGFILYDIFRIHLCMPGYISSGPDLRAEPRLSWDQLVKDDGDYDMAYHWVGLYAFYQSVQ